MICKPRSGRGDLGVDERLMRARYVFTQSAQRPAGAGGGGLVPSEIACSGVPQHVRAQSGRRGWSVDDAEPGGLSPDGRWSQDLCRQIRHDVIPRAHSSREMPDPELTFEAGISGTHMYISVRCLGCRKSGDYANRVTGRKYERAPAGRMSDQIRWAGGTDAWMCGWGDGYIWWVVEITYKATLCPPRPRFRPVYRARTYRV